MVASSRMFVHESVIARYTLPGGDVWRYVRGISVEVERAAKALAPVRTGRLRDSIHMDPKGSNQHGSNFRVSAGAGHAGFVVRGTAGKLMPGKRRMVLYGDNPMGWINAKRNYAGYVGMHVKQVDGQLPNPFLQTALRAVLVRHGLI